MSKTVSINPYFKIKEGNLNDVKALLQHLSDAVKTEEKCLWYDFFISADDSTMYCREAYLGAEGLLEHIDNISALAPTLFELTDLIRCDVHGSAEEVEKLREPIKDLNPEYYIFQCGIGKP